jgi:hypothetical protein
MLNIANIMERDNIVQYLAMYTATKGLMVQTTPEDIHKIFTEFKQSLRKGEYTLDWLVDTVIMKWGIPPDPVKKTGGGIKKVIDDLTDILAYTCIKPEEKGGGVITAEIPKNLPFEENVIRKIKKMIESKKLVEKEKKPRKSKNN